MLAANDRKEFRRTEGLRLGDWKLGEESVLQGQV
jgi:hypothetical protein